MTFFHDICCEFGQTVIGCPWFEPLYSCCSFFLVGFSVTSSVVLMCYIYPKFSIDVSDKMMKHLLPSLPFLLVAVVRKMTCHNCLNQVLWTSGKTSVLLRTNIACYCCVMLCGPSLASCCYLYDVASYIISVIFLSRAFF